jgi:hypothetical protein
MTALTKKAATSRRTNGGGERAVVYRGIKILPVPGKRSPTAKAIQEALRLESKSTRGDPART